MASDVLTAWVSDSTSISVENGLRKAGIDKGKIEPDVGNVVVEGEVVKLVVVVEMMLTGGTLLGKVPLGRVLRTSWEDSVVTTLSMWDEE